MLVDASVVVPAKLVDVDHWVGIVCKVHLDQNIGSLVDVLFQEIVVDYPLGDDPAPSLPILPIAASGKGLRFEFRVGSVEGDHLLQPHDLFGTFARTSRPVLGRHGLGSL